MTTSKTVTVNDLMQQNYVYNLTEPMGKNFSPDFKPELTPKDMLSLGIFGGKYLTDCKGEFPKDWFTKAIINDEIRDPQLNFFKVNASLSLKEWQKSGWIYKDDPRGWFQWYCRYYMGRRIVDEDTRQIKRWKNTRRHIVQIQKHCKKGDFSCRPVQRQALLHWAYDSRNI